MSEAAHPLVISGADVRRLVSVADCIALMRETMRAVSSGAATLPLRIGAAAPHGTFAVAAMPGWLGEWTRADDASATVCVPADARAHAPPPAADPPGVLGGKLISVAVRRRDAPVRSHQGVVVLFDTTTGAPAAIMDASAITALRTAAATAVATDVLARQDASTLAIVGTGEQAWTHVASLAHVRSFRRVRVYGRHAARTAAFGERIHAEHGLLADVAPSVREAVADADVVVTATSASEPVLLGDWLRAGTHVNLVGASSRAAREADDAVVARSRFFVDYRASALAQAGELLHAMGNSPEAAAAAISAEIGEVLAGTVAGRTGAGEITVYKSLGIAAQDLALAAEVLRRARAAGAGTRVEL